MHCTNEIQQLRNHAVWVPLVPDEAHDTDQEAQARNRLRLETPLIHEDADEADTVDLGVCRPLVEHIHHEWHLLQLHEHGLRVGIECQAAEENGDGLGPHGVGHEGAEQRSQKGHAPTSTMALMTD